MELKEIEKDIENRLGCSTAILKSVYLGAKEIVLIRGDKSAKIDKKIKRVVASKDTN